MRAAKDPRDPATCKSCGAFIVWALYEKRGAPKPSIMPMDFQPAERGIWKLVLRKGKVWAIWPERGYTGKRFDSHFGTCPKAADHRRRQ